MFWIVVLGIVVIAFCALVSSLFALIKTRVPVMRTPSEYLVEIIKTIDLSPGQTVVDLGCADARTLLALCRRDGVRGRGYELNGPVCLGAWMRVLFSGKCRRVKIFWQDFFRGDLEDVDVVFCYLMPGLMSRVGKKCQEEMRPGSQLVSMLWQVPEWTPVKIVLMGVNADSLYVYEITNAMDERCHHCHD
jgi:SAM-dependent methyltransferase